MGIPMRVEQKGYRYMLMPYEEREDDTGFEK